MKYVFDLSQLYQYIIRLTAYVYVKSGTAWAVSKSSLRVESPSSAACHRRSRYPRAGAMLFYSLHADTQTPDQDLFSCSFRAIISRFPRVGGIPRYNRGITALHGCYRVPGLRSQVQCRLRLLCIKVNSTFSPFWSVNHHHQEHAPDWWVSPSAPVRVRHLQPVHAHGDAELFQIIGDRLPAVFDEVFQLIFSSWSEWCGTMPEVCL